MFGQASVLIGSSAANHTFAHQEREGPASLTPTETLVRHRPHNHPSPAVTIMSWPPGQRGLVPFAGCSRTSTLQDTVARIIPSLFHSGEVPRNRQ